MAWGSKNRKHRARLVRRANKAAQRVRMISEDDYGRDCLVPCSGAAELVFEVQNAPLAYCDDEYDSVRKAFVLCKEAGY